jgi:cell division control protein 7
LDPTARTFTTNIPSITPEGKPWREFVETLNPKLREQTKSDLCLNPYTTSEASSGGSFYPPPPSSSSPGPDAVSGEAHWQPGLVDVQDHETDVEQALDLLERLLHPESIKRITPQQALYHPFLHESGDEKGDDAFFPHPFGEGVCGEWHFVDPVTEEFRVRIRTEDGSTSVIPVMAGEGMAIGDEPCEFHRGEDTFKLDE